MIGYLEIFQSFQNQFEGLTDGGVFFQNRPKSEPKDKKAYIVVAFLTRLRTGVYGYDDYDDQNSTIRISVYVRDTGNTMDVPYLSGLIGKIKAMFPIKDENILCSRPFTHIIGTDDHGFNVGYIQASLTTSINNK